MAENWIPWKPNGTVLAEQYYASKLCSDIEGLSLFLEDQNSTNKIRVLFKGTIASYRETYEGFRLEKIQSLYDQDYDGNWTFFTIQNSSYIKWLAETSLEIITEDRYTHFCFLTEESIIDVISKFEPTIEFLDLVKNYENKSQ